MASQPPDRQSADPTVPRPAPRDDPDFWLSLGVDLATRDGIDPATLTLDQLADLGRQHLTRP
jgi:hypothetical protein